MALIAKWLELIRLDSILSTTAIICICILILYLCKVCRQSPVISFLLAGLLVGPFCLNLLPQGLKTNSPMGEMAIAFLLFVIGLEVDSSILSWKDRHRFTMGVYQVLITGFLLSFLFLLYHFSYLNSLRLGLLCAMSSTAVVLKIIEERKETHAHYAVNAITISIVQDLFAVLLMALMALPADFKNQSELVNASIDFIKIILFVPILYFGARFLLPKILKKINQKKSPELFMFTLLIVVLGSAVLGHVLCKSAGMGAFIAGFALAGSPMAFQIRADIDPFKQVLISIFFLMIGASFNVFIFQTHWQMILIFLLVIPLLKWLSTFIAMLLTKNDALGSFKTAASICQIGEFSLLLAVIAQGAGWLEESYTQTFFAVAIISMGLTPLAITFAHTKWAFQAIAKYFGATNKHQTNHELPIQAVIIGYGIAGQKCAETLDSMGVRYSIIDQNTQTIENLKEQGIHAIYGDGSRHEILTAAGIDSAQWLIIAVPSPVDRLTITCEARLLNEKISIIVRSHYVKEDTFLQEVGATIVISEEDSVSNALAEVLKSQMAICMMPTN